MGGKNIIEPSSLSMLARALESHCRNHGILSPEARESVAVSVLGFYRAGADCEEDLLRLLDEEDRPRCSGDSRHPVRAIPFPR